MNIEEMLAFAKNFKSNEVYRKMESIRQQRVASLLNNLAFPITSESEIYLHTRLGGQVEGLKTNLLDELIEELEQKRKNPEGK